jgi:hypothetical protein
MFWGQQFESFAYLVECLRLNLLADISILPMLIKDVVSLKGDEI